MDNNISPCLLLMLPTKHVHIRSPVSTGQIHMAESQVMSVQIPPWSASGVWLANTPGALAIDHFSRSCLIMGLGHYRIIISLLLFLSKMSGHFDTYLAYLDFTNTMMNTKRGFGKGSCDNVPR